MDIKLEHIIGCIISTSIEAAKTANSIDAQDNGIKSLANCLRHSDLYSSDSLEERLKVADYLDRLCVKNENRSNLS